VGGGGLGEVDPALALEGRGFLDLYWTPKGGRVSAAFPVAEMRRRGPCGRSIRRGCGGAWAPIPIGLDRGYSDEGQILAFRRGSARR